MRAIRKFALLFVLMAQTVHGQFTPILTDPTAYTTAVIDALWVKIRNHGLSNLPVLDSTVNYNVTDLGVELIGPVSFEDGFVQDVDLVYGSPQHFTSTTGTTSGTVNGRILFENITISKPHNENNITSTVSFLLLSNIEWDIVPDDLIMRLIRRRFAMQSAMQPQVVNLLLPTAYQWEPILLKFVEEIVQTMEFPQLDF
ncbi:uncharacterized protein LOC124306723 isoform X2 [Neodiprion virginianus]|uniref:uncharacterized protein LOC124184331 isoform X2 n=1 Tax=Neodiprion fabricii TaxID=2872261 RepID=UPI001ED92010|nr:uncharacterized protein LOC124184331 isoform X2 [Neodiprion fabricii]XP_046623621.1 uncharacterized protein LOC124306723 isoform X2 [Neodiprion virginianus]